MLSKTKVKYCLQHLVIKFRRKAPGGEVGMLWTWFVVKTRDSHHLAHPKLPTQQEQQRQRDHWTLKTTKCKTNIAFWYISASEELLKETYAESIHYDLDLTYQFDEFFSIVCTFCSLQHLLLRLECVQTETVQLDSHCTDTLRTKLGIPAHRRWSKLPDIAGCFPGGCHCSKLNANAVSTIE